MNTFTLAFLFVLGCSVAVRLWLAQRHVRHVAGHRNAVPTEFADRIGLDAHRRAADYTCAKARLGMLHALVDTTFVLLLTLGGGLQGIDALWRGVLGDGVLQSAAVIGSVVMLASLVDIPLDLYRTFVVEARFGFNKMTLPMFFADMLRHALVGVLLGAPVAIAAVWMMQTLGPDWWLYAWVAWIAFNLFVLAVYPVWIAPMFNKFTPLEQPDLRTRVESLLRRCGFAARGLFVMDGSRRSNHGNAYFTGFGRNKRVVFFDTLLDRLDPPEIEAVLAHELGHFKRRHVMKRMIISFATSFAMLWLLGVALKSDWFFSGLGVTAHTAGTALTLFFLAMPSFTFLFRPLLSVYARRQEFEADDYAVQNARAVDLASALVKLYKDNASTLTPDPIHSAFYDSHPPASVRIARLQHAG